MKLRYKPGNILWVVAVGLSFILSCKKDETIPRVNANFNGDKTSILVGETIAFTDLSAGEPTNWEWIFGGGDPSTSTSQNPRVTYSEPGTYSVTLVASNQKSSDTETKTNFIEVYLGIVADFSASDSVIDETNQIVFTDISEGSPLKWEWAFEGGFPSSSTEKNPTISYPKAGIFNVSLTVSNQLGSNVITKRDFIVVLPASGLKAFYPFNGNANDESPENHNGTVFGASLTTDRFENPNSAYEFDGVNDYIRTFSTFDFKCRTLSLWINPSDISGINPYNHVAISQDDDNLLYGILRVEIDNGNLKLWAGGVLGTYQTSNVGVNRWYHLVLMRDANKTYYFVDGCLVHTSVSDGYGSTFDPSREFVIGSGRSTALQFFKGKIDDIRIYNRVLNNKEIELLFKGEERTN